MCGVPVAGLQGSIKFKGSKLRKLLRKIHDQGAKAKFVVTGDRHLSLKAYRKISILTPIQFLVK